MGRVIKSSELARRPDPPGREGQRDAERILADRERLAALHERERERILELAGLLAEEMIGEAVEADPRRLERSYRRAVELLGDVPPLALRVNPLDRGAGGADRIAREAGCEVIEDEAVGRGGCRLEAEGASVDATLEALFGALDEASRGNSDV
ncbi:MAG: FliH/SctL family protein [Polyangia bacterium]